MLVIESCIAESQIGIACSDVGRLIKGQGIFPRGAEHHEEHRREKRGHEQPNQQRSQRSPRTHMVDLSVPLGRA
jgi:hypothetical protein